VEKLKKKLKLKLKLKLKKSPESISSLKFFNSEARLFPPRKDTTHPKCLI